MMFDYETLKFIWWILIGALLIGFAITDGMDLGVGMLLTMIGKTEDERRVMINSVGPHWDGNQVWLITAGGAIFAAWPFVYAAAFSGFYMAMLLVLFALFFRPVGFDYRAKIDDPRWRRTWDWSLFVAGVVPSLIFGVAFGNLLQGVPFHLDEFFRSHYDGWFIFALLPLLNPFAILAGLISVGMLLVQGAMWLQIRTLGTVAARARMVAMYGAPVIAVLFALAGVWIAYGIDGFRIVTQPEFGSSPNPLGKIVEVASGAWLDIYRHYPVAMAAPLCGIGGMLFVALLSRYGRPGIGFVASSLGIAGIIGTAGLSLFPFVMPSSTVPNSSLTMWDATSSHLTLTIMFWAVAIFLPIVLAYTIWCYVRMWGKVTAEGIQRATHTSY